ncbi:DUF6960 family protein [Botrimarina hoheduenensis]|uniref:Uncharacterized protein n=1 Tax=Botrimarina hoheduenensis TaxID=2528000 RepID=A0A5C5WCB3_9BACT|nr:hypothetical protein [Botrimarina hoheduenensis]TWT47729.1 hypothetical protein Pla111_13490 [Botrimarina hoheduenensis]
MSDSLPPLPPLKTDPKHGYFPWWPEDGDNWVHPQDVAVARSVIPSSRVWRREGIEPATPEDYVVMRYGSVQIRVRRTLWRELRSEGFEVGDMVEVRPRGMTNEPHTGHVRDVLWNEHEGRIEYFLLGVEGTPFEHAYTAQDLRHTEAPRPQEEFRIEPSGDEGDFELLDP